jgi:uncharacterized membrane protein
LTRLLAVLVVAALMLAVVQPAMAFTSHSLTIQVYPDGYLTVTQRISLSSSSSSVQIPLLSSVGSDLVATDQNGSPLSYQFSSSGSNITVYTLGATSVTLRYDTDSLTSKNGTVWTLKFSTFYNSTVILPQYSSITYVSGVPDSVNLTRESPEATLLPGTWTIVYGVSISGVPGSSNTTSTAGTPGGAGGQPQLLEEAAIGAAVAVLAALVGWRLWKRRGPGDGGKELRPDDRQVLNFIQEKGGKVLEPEIRMKFALPKTSAWRQIKRLERLGYVKVTKIGSQNQIEVVRKREGD